MSAGAGGLLRIDGDLWSNSAGACCTACKELLISDGDTETSLLKSSLLNVFVVYENGSPCISLISTQSVTGGRTFLAEGNALWQAPF
jgi:hypothetical protein